MGVTWSSNLDQQKKETEAARGVAASLRAEKHQAEEEERKRKEFKWNQGLAIDWSRQGETDLRTRILTGTKDSRGKDIKMKLLVFGLTGHGKSTLCNGFRSALLGDRHVSHYHQTGSAGASRTFTRGICGAVYGEAGNLCIMDMSGIYESKSFKDQDVTDILSGKVPFYVKLTEHLEVIDRQAMAIPEPGTNDVSCVIIVSKPDIEFSPEIKRLMDIVDNLARDGVISRHLVLTFMDKTDSLFTDAENLPKFLDSGKIQQAVKVMSDRTGISPSATSFVRNYCNESTTNMYSNILLLTVLESILYDAKENHERKLSVERMKSL